MENNVLKYHNTVVLSCEVDGGGFIGPCGIGECITSLALLTARANHNILVQREIHRFRFKVIPNEEKDGAAEEPLYDQRGVMFGDSVRLIHVNQNKAITVVIDEENHLPSVALKDIIDPEEDNRSQCFRILPASQVRAEGNFVQHCDEILLHFEETKSMLSVVPGAVSVRLGVGFHHLVLNTRRQSVFVAHCTDFAPLTNKSVRVGNPLLLYNKVSMSMITLVTPDASTAMLPKTEPDFMDDPRMSKDPYQLYFASLPANMAQYGDIGIVTLSELNKSTIRSVHIFSFEIVSGTAGGPINTYSVYKIRHMLTGRFISISKRLDVGGPMLKETLEPCLTDEEMYDAASHFRIHPCQTDATVNIVDVTINYNDLIQIESAHYPGVWLEVDEGKFVCSRHRHFEQTLEVVPPLPGQIETVSEALTMFPSISSYLTRPTPPLLHAALNCLREMACFLTDDKEKTQEPSEDSVLQPNELKQNILVEANAHLVVLKLLDYFIQSKQKGTQDGVVLCYHVLTLLIKQRPVNAELLSPFVGFLVSQLEQRTGTSTAKSVAHKVSETILELYTDNISLLSNVKRETVRLFLDFLSKNLNPRYAEIVQTLCVLKSKGYYRNQTLVLDQLFPVSESQPTAIFAILPNMTLERDQVMLTNPFKENKKMSLKEFEDAQGEVGCRYIASVFEMLASVAKGNRKSCNKIASLKMSAIILKIVKTSLFKALQAAALSLLVEYQISGSLDQALTVLKWDSVSKEQAEGPVVTMNLSEEDKELFTNLKEWAKEFFRTVEMLDAKDYATCMMLRSFAKALYQLVRVGLYEEPHDRVALSDACRKTVSVRSDVIDDTMIDKATGAILVSSHNAVYVSAKIELLRILNLLLFQDALRNCNFVLWSFKSQGTARKDRYEVGTMIDKAEDYLYGEKKGWLPPYATLVADMLEMLRFRHTSVIEETLLFLFRSSDMPRYVYECLKEMTILDSNYLSLRFDKFRDRVADLVTSVEDATCGPKQITPQLQYIVEILSSTPAEDQKLMRSCKLAEPIISILSHSTWNLLDADTHNMYALCFRVIVRYCEGNPVHQQEFAQFVSKLLTLAEKGVRGIGLMEALAEIHRNNENLLTVEESLIQRVVNLSIHDHCAVVFLKALSKKGNDWHQSNLGLIAKYVRSQPEVFSNVTQMPITLIQEGEYYARDGANSTVSYHMELYELCAAMVHIHASPIENEVIKDLANKTLLEVPLYYKTMVLKSLNEYFVAQAANPLHEKMVGVLSTLMKEVFREEVLNTAYVAKWGKYKMRPMSYPMKEDPISPRSSSTHFYGKRVAPGTQQEARTVMLHSETDDDAFNRIVPVEKEQLLQEHNDFLFDGVFPLLKSLIEATGGSPDTHHVVQALHALCLKLLNEQWLKHVKNENIQGWKAIVALYMASRKRVSYLLTACHRIEEVSRQLAKSEDESEIDRAFNVFCTQYDIAASTDRPAYGKLLDHIRSKDSTLRVLNLISNKSLNNYVRQVAVRFLGTKLRENWETSNGFNKRSEGAKMDYLKMLEDRQCDANQTSPPMAHVLFELTAHPELRMTAITTLIGLLNKGNRMIQRSIVEYIRAESGILLMSVRKQLQNATAAIYLVDKQAKMCTTEEAQEELHVQSTMLSFCTVKLLRFLQLLCEGHNAQLQMRLRTQPEKKNSVNLIKDIINLFKTWVDVMSLDNIDIGIQALRTMTEVCQGPATANQAEMVENGVAQLLGKVILGTIPRYDALMTEDPVIMNEVTKECVTLLLALTEGLTSTSTVPTTLLNAIPIAALLDRVSECWVKGQFVEMYDNISPFASEQHQHIEAEEAEDDGVDPEGFMTVATAALSKHNVGLQAQLWIESIKCQESECQENAEEDDIPFATELGLGLFMYLLGMSRFRKPLRIELERQPFYRWCFARVGVIEIQRADLGNRLERVLFLIRQKSKYLLETTMREFTESVDRSSISTKLNGLMDSYEDIIVETNIYANVAQNKFVGIFVSHAFKIEMSSLVMSLVISIFLIVTMSKEHSQATFFMSGEAYYIFQALSYAQLCQEFWMFIGWLAVHGQVHFAKSVQKMVRTLRRRIQFGEDNEETNAELRRWQTFPLKPIWWQADKGSRMFMTYDQFWFNLLFAAAAPLGLALNPIFFSIQIFRVVKHSVALQNVVSAVTLRATELIQAAILATLIIFLFSVMAFLQFNDKFYNPYENDELGTGFHCETLANCFLVILVYGIRTDGGIGMRMGPPQWNNSDQAAQRLVFEFTFWMILVVIFLNIIFGIILDTFAELRDRRQDRLKDMATCCFICGLEAHDFDKIQGHSFQRHYKEEHNQWDYIRFFHHLTLKEPTEYTGQETYVWDKLSRKDTSFLPVEKAIALEHLVVTSDDKHRDVVIINALKSVHKIYSQHLSEILFKERVSHVEQLTKSAVMEDEGIFAEPEVGSRPATRSNSIALGSGFDQDDEPTAEAEWLSDHDSGSVFEDEEKEGYLTDQHREKLMSELSQLIQRNHERASKLLKS